MSYIGETTDDRGPGSYSMVMPKLAGTRVDIFRYENDMWVEQFSDIIQKYQVLTQDAYYTSNIHEDFTVWRIVASQPIAVISGSGRAHFGNEYHSQHVCDALPSRAASGTEYVTSPVVLGIDSTFYRLRIVSAEDDVTVTIPELGISRRIPVGEFLEYDSNSLTSMMRVHLLYMFNTFHTGSNLILCILVKAIYIVLYVYGYMQYIVILLVLLF